MIYAWLLTLLMSAVLADDSKTLPPRGQTTAPLIAEVDAGGQKLRLTPASIPIGITSSYFKLACPPASFEAIEKLSGDSLRITLRDGTSVTGSLTEGRLQFTDPGPPSTIAAKSIKSVRFTGGQVKELPLRELQLRLKNGDLLRAELPTVPLSLVSKLGTISRSWNEIQSIEAVDNRFVVHTTAGEKLVGIAQPVSLKLLVDAQEAAWNLQYSMLARAEVVNRPPSPTQSPVGLSGTKLRIEIDAPWATISIPSSKWTHAQPVILAGKATATPIHGGDGHQLRVDCEETPAVVEVFATYEGGVPDKTKITIRKHYRGKVRVVINPGVPGSVDQWVESQGTSPAEGRTFDIRP